MIWPINWKRTKEKTASESAAPAQSTIVDRPGQSTQVRGQLAEQLAMQFLHHNKLVTVARNIRWRGGEIDLVCLDQETLVFVEVRLRSNGNFGSAADSITPDKKRRIVTTARWWLKGLGHTHAKRQCRFDTLLFDKLDIKNITWIRDAFTGDDILRPSVLNERRLLS